MFRRGGKRGDPVARSLACMLLVLAYSPRTPRSQTVTSPEDAQISIGTLVPHHHCHRSSSHVNPALDRMPYDPRAACDRGHTHKAASLTQQRADM